MHLEASTSGTRIRNSWVENNFGWNIYLGGGTRLKLSDLHLVTGKSGGIHLRPSYSQITGVSMVNCSPGIDVKGVTNAISDMYITQSGSGAAIRERDVKKCVHEHHDHGFEDRHRHAGNPLAVLEYRRLKRD
ncbi:hypothetical protein ACFQL7_16485 [Halocatena marina]|uniref:Right handed beta helix domain-containing protein n=1 Tax=Halocatena marina TaxID=2934937 RepID=A0ABD5YPK0_9EURY